MAIPDFQTLMLPLLRHLRDGKERGTQETLDALATEFKLTEQERTIPLASGPIPVFTNRVAWAKSHLKAAGLLEAPQRGFYKITPRGLEVLKRNPERVDIHLLKTFPEYQRQAAPIYCPPA